MTLEWADENFEVHSNHWIPRVRCLAVQPHVIDFPARCVGVPDHAGMHHSAPRKVSVLDEPTAITYWNDDE